MMKPDASGLTGIRTLLENLIESAQQSWTYSIFWYVSHSGQGSLLVWGAGYYNGEKDEGKETNSSSSSLISIAEREYRKRVLSTHYSLICEQQEFADEEEVTDRQWFFFLSRLKSFVEVSGLPGKAMQSSFPVWITGRENLANSSCQRAVKAQEYGIRTLVFIPSEIGVIELGSTVLNIQSMDLVTKAVPLLNFIYSSKMFQNVRPSESSDSVGNSATVRTNNVSIRSNAHLSDENEELSLGLHLGYKACPVKPQYEAKSSSSSVGNYPVPMVNGKEKPQFSGKLQIGSDDHSDSTDINAFVQILKGRRG